MLRHEQRRARGSRPARRGARGSRAAGSPASRSGCHWPVNGSGNAPPPSMFGSETRRNSSSCATPTVAISNTSRGLSNSRRTTDSSMTMPMTAVATIGEPERQPVRHAVLHVEQREDRGAERADLALGEVQHAGRAVDEHEPGGEHRVDQAEDDAVEQRLLGDLDAEHGEVSPPRRRGRPHARDRRARRARGPVPRSARVPSP